MRSVDGEVRTSLAVVESRVEEHQSVIYRNGAADFQMSEKDVEAVNYSAYGALITTGTVLAAEPSRGATFHAFDLARQAGLPLIFDLDYRPYSWPSAEDAAETYSRAGGLCDIIIGNDVEFGFMAGDYDRGLDKARELAREAAAGVTERAFAALAKPVARVCTAEVPIPYAAQLEQAALPSVDRIVAAAREIVA